MNTFTVKYATETGLQDGPEFETLYDALAHCELTESEPWVVLTPWVIECYPHGVKIMHTVKELYDMDAEKHSDREIMENVINIKSSDPHDLVCICGKHYIIAEASNDDHLAFCIETAKIAPRYDFASEDAFCHINMCACGRPIEIYVGASDLMLDFTQDQMEP